MANTPNPKTPTAADEAAAAAKAADEAAAAPVRPTIKVGDKVRLSAVHGDLYHPFLTPELVFKTDTSYKVEVDAWMVIQYDAGKLKIED